MNAVERQILRYAIAAYENSDTINRSDTELIVTGLKELLDETEADVVFVPIPQEEEDF